MLIALHTADLMPAALRGKRAGKGLPLLHNAEDFVAGSWSCAHVGGADEDDQTLCRRRSWGSGGRRRGFLQNGRVVADLAGEFRHLCFQCVDSCLKGRVRRRCLYRWRDAHATGHDHDWHNDGQENDKEQKKGRVRCPWMRQIWEMSWLAPGGAWLWLAFLGRG